MNTDRVTHVLCFDLETTGLGFGSERVTEFSALLWNVREPVPSWRLRCRVDPGKPMTAEAAAITGLTDDQLVGCPRLEDVLGMLERRLRVCYHSDMPDQVLLCAHNAAKFDVRMLMEEFVRLRVDFVDYWAGLRVHGCLDTRPMGEFMFPQLRRHTLTYLHRAFFGHAIEGAHGALQDTEALQRILAHMPRHLWSFYTAPLKTSWAVWRKTRLSHLCPPLPPGAPPLAVSRATCPLPAPSVEGPAVACSLPAPSVELPRACPAPPAPLGAGTASGEEGGDERDDRAASRGLKSRRAGKTYALRSMDRLTRSMRLLARKRRKILGAGW